VSLVLNQGTRPVGLEIKTFGFGSDADVVVLGDYEISFADFLSAAKYVLTNTDLMPNDPRIRFVMEVQLMTIGQGYNPGGQRFVTNS